MMGCPVVRDFRPGRAMGGIITFFTLGTVAKFGTAILRPAAAGEEEEEEEEVLGPTRICL